jgi:hypothetical protein
MAVPKRKPPPPPNERQLAAWRASVRPPRSRVEAECYEQLRQLADETGRDVHDLLDWWADRAAIREYDGETDRDAAELAAVEDVRDIVTVQRRLSCV